MDKPPIHRIFTNEYDFSKFQFFSKNLHKKSLFSQFCLVPTSITALLVVSLLCYNSFTTFWFIPVYSMENNKDIEHKLATSNSPSSISSYTMNNEETKSNHNATTRRDKQIRKDAPSLKPLTFANRVSRFFNEKNSCKIRVFMTWISEIESFGKREKFTIESLFKFNPNACLLIVSNSMDSSKGTKILQPFLSLNFKVMAVKPDFKSIFMNTMADDWYNQLEKGQISQGEISIGQNLSNLLRLVLLYKYGGVYMDTDFIVLKRLDGLKNSICAQSVDPYTKHWSRLNNALMIFDIKHPLLIKFIEEFALNFNGNKWGYNGPYLVSRVVKRVKVDNGSIEGVSEFTILPPPAFYVVGWGKIGRFFKKPVDGEQLKWVNENINYIEEESYAVHLWNRESKQVEVEDGSIISHLMERSCIFCNVSTPT